MVEKCIVYSSDNKSKIIPISELPINQHEHLFKSRNKNLLYRSRIVHLISNKTNYLTSELFNKTSSDTRKIVDDIKNMTNSELQELIDCSSSNKCECSKKGLNHDGYVSYINLASSC